MKLLFYMAVAFPASAFVAFVAVHTDEETFTLGVVLLLAFALSIGFRGKAPATIALIGLPVCLMETLADYGFVRAPYPTHPGVSWPALVALIPAAVGALSGSRIRLHARPVLR